MKKLILFFISIFLVQISTAQIQSGKVVYKIRPLNLEDFIRSDLDLEAIKKSSSYQNAAKVVTYFQTTLYFNAEESFMQVVEQMSLDNKQAGDFNSALSMIGSKGSYYSNIREDKFLHHKDSELIQSNFNNIMMDWEIHDETREIHGYTCIKATGTLVTAFVDVPVIAWFTPELPFPFGPQEIRGLPGLILEMNFRNGYNYYADSIELSAKPLNIIEPNKGKKITWEESIIQSIENHKNIIKNWGIPPEQDRLKDRNEKLLERLAKKDRK